MRLWSGGCCSDSIHHLFPRKTRLSWDPWSPIFPSFSWFTCITLEKKEVKGWFLKAEEKKYTERLKTKQNGPLTLSPDLPLIPGSPCDKSMFYTFSVSTLYLGGIWKTCCFELLQSLQLVWTYSLSGLSFRSNTRPSWAWRPLEKWKKKWNVMQIDAKI